MTPGTATKPRPAPSSDWALDSPNLFVFPTHARTAAGGVPTQEQAADIDRRQATLDQATANRDAIAARADAANEAASAARGRATTMDNAHCRAEQGERIQEGASGELGPRNPNRWDSLPRTDRDGEDEM
jgi:hypothetical protein